MCWTATLAVGGEESRHQEIVGERLDECEEQKLPTGSGCDLEQQCWFGGDLESHCHCDSQAGKWDHLGSTLAGDSLTTPTPQAPPSPTTQH